MHSVSLSYTHAHTHSPLKSPLPCTFAGLINTYGVGAVRNGRETESDSRGLSASSHLNKHEPRHGPDCRPPNHSIHCRGWMTAILSLTDATPVWNNVFHIPLGPVALRRLKIKPCIFSFFFVFLFKETHYLFHSALVSVVSSQKNADIPTRRKIAEAGKKKI